MRTNINKQRRQRYGTAACALVMALGVIGCGGSSNTDNPTAVSSDSVEEFSTALIALHADPVASSKDTSGDNLLDLRGDWPTWSGEDTAIRYDSNAGAIRIPASGSGELILGVRYFAQTLTAGARYTLSMEASNNEAAVVLVLVRAGGAVAQITNLADGSTGDWAAARPGKTLSFDAPEGIVGFYLQVQSDWHESSAHNLAAQLRFTGDSDSGDGSGDGTPPAGDGFSLAGTWADWSGNPTGIRYDSASNSLQVPAPGGGNNQVIGVQRYTQALTAGQTYTVDATGSSNGTALIFTLRNSAGAPLTVTNAGTGASGQSLWVSGGQQVAFTAPAGVVGFDVQAQSPWQASNATTVRASLSGNGQPPAPTPAPTPEPAPAPTPSPTGDFRPAGYNTLFLADEFNGNSLDRSKWCTRLPFGGGPTLQVPDAECTKFIGQGSLDYANEEEQQRFRDFAAGTNEALHQLGGGTLKLRATRTGRNDYLRFEAGALRSKAVFKPEGASSFYMTSRVRLPDVLGVWPAFFVLPSLEPSGTSSWPPEIDIFEAPINNTSGENAYTMIQHGRIRGAQTSSGNSEWTYAADGFNIDWGFYTSPTYLRERWIVIGAEWTANRVCYFIDDIKTGCENYRWVTNSGQPANAATLIMYLAVGGPWAGKNGIDDGKFPTEMEVDYIRVYKK